MASIKQDVAVPIVVVPEQMGLLPVVLVSPVYMTETVVIHSRDLTFVVEASYWLCVLDF